MPRIDPLQLLNCLQVLLSPKGGILSQDEVKKLASLMTKFSKKLVSKLVYILILKSTETHLLGSFMGEGGWSLVNSWLSDAMMNQNWALVRELLELLLITPVDVERLKANNIPKLVKSLSKRNELEGIDQLSCELVQQWLRIVKSETQQHHIEERLPQPQETMEAEEEDDDPVDEVEVSADTLNSMVNVIEMPMVDVIQEGGEAVDEDANGEANDPLADDVVEKKVLTNVDANEVVGEGVEKGTGEKEKEGKENEEKKREKKSSSSSLSSHRSSSSKHRSSSSGSSSKSKSSSRDKSKDSHKEKSSSSNSSSSSSRDKDKSRDRHGKDRDKSRDRDRDRHKSSSSSSRHSSSSKSSKDKEKEQKEKDKDVLAKLMPPSLQKLPKIPKKDPSKSSESEELKKGSISIVVRNTAEDRPKTVKVFKSKMRLTGLEEEVKPAPPRPVKKPVVPPVSLPSKRPSPIRDAPVVPEKKIRIDPAERPGAIKLIPPKPKPPVLQESDMFMDALNASATSKKEPKKRKRRPSNSKESTSSPPTSPTASNATTATQPTSPTTTSIKNIVSINFYQDTLASTPEEPEAPENGKEEEKEDVEADREIEQMEEAVAESVTKGRSGTPTESDEVVDETPIKGVKGVLVYVRKKGPKKSLKWKADDELVEVQYFELDETERVNVTKTFCDMAKMDVRSEREALLTRKLGDDMMDVQTLWRVPMELDLPVALAEMGSKSLEKDIQYAREKSVLQALYFNKSMLPDTPAEPDLESYQIKDPIPIPTEVEEGENQENDYTATPWPEPKGSPPPPVAPINQMPPAFLPPNMQPFPGNFPNPAMQMNNFQNNMQPFGPPGGFNINGPMNPNIPPNPMMGPPDMMRNGMMPNNFNGGPPEAFNPMMNDNVGFGGPPFNQGGPPGPGMFPPQNNFNNRGRGGFGGGGGGGFRRGGGGGWVRMGNSGPGPGHGPNNTWTNPNNVHRGGPNHHGPNRGGRICKNVRNNGFCRNRDNCPFVHPNS